MVISTDQLKKILADYVDEGDIVINQKAFDALDKVSATTGLLNKIAGTFSIEGSYVETGLEDLNGPEITNGNALEEYFLDFAEPADFDETGANALAPSYPHHAPIFYSIEQGKKTFKTTVLDSGYTQSFKDAGETASYVSIVMGRLSDSAQLWENELKRKTLGIVAKRHSADGISSKPYAASTATTLAEGDYVTDSGNLYIVRKPIANNTPVPTAVNAGQLVKLDLETKITLPQDTATGEAFIKSVKDYARKFAKPRSGYSLNGNIAGVGTYKLFIKEGILPSLEVDTMAGAFNRDMLAFGVQVVEVADFGDNEDAIAMLIDTRGTKISYVENYATSQINGEGGFVNYYLHKRPLVRFSPNVKTHVWNMGKI